MGTVFKKTFTKPLPADAELFTREGQQFARWKDAKGKTRKALVTASKDGQPRILIEAKTYTAKYRDGDRIVREVSTGCRDEQAARSVLADLERRAELHGVLRGFHALRDLHVVDELLVKARGLAAREQIPERVEFRVAGLVDCR